MGMIGLELTNRDRILSDYNLLPDALRKVYFVGDGNLRTEMAQVRTRVLEVMKSDDGLKIMNKYDTASRFKDEAGITDAVTGLRGLIGESVLSPLLKLINSNSAMPNGPLAGKVYSELKSQRQVRLEEIRELEANATARTAEYTARINQLKSEVRDISGRLLNAERSFTHILLTTLFEFLWMTSAEAQKVVGGEAAAGNSIMPPTANMVSGKISV